MKSILFRSIGISLVLFCLTFSIFADGEMGTGSKSGSQNGGFAPTTNQTNTKTDELTKVGETDFFGWIADVFADFFN